MPSGKQILLRLLSELSQGATPPPTGLEIADKVRAAFLLDGSTASESWSAVEHIDWSAGHWSAGPDEPSMQVRAGITYDGIFLSDLFEELTYPDGIPLHVASKYPELTPERYKEAMRFIWLILSSVQWFACVASVEDEPDGKAHGDDLLAKCIQKLHHFRKHPEDFQ